MNKATCTKCNTNGLCENCTNQMHARLRGAGFNLDRIVPMHVGDGSVPLLLDGVPIRGFRDGKSADDAAQLMRRYWPAAKGRRITVGVGGAR